jgi:hypothetical protein
VRSVRRIPDITSEAAVLRGGVCERKRAGLPPGGGLAGVEVMPMVFDTCKLVE